MFGAGWSVEPTKGDLLPMNTSLEDTAIDPNETPTPETDEPAADEEVETTESNTEAPEEDQEAGEPEEPTAPECA